ncbi:hypothetical protein MLD38_029369 [Melastoma candidum]|uniref:Uncharacterized protein n=1 Tax=Melastoma candidum TaxID=119954 RepID=A0ACB9N3R8_9MYRT|nr:hypothetical protein MLD38_029369 [Melastoma candidum]
MKVGSDPHRLWLPPLLRRPPGSSRLVSKPRRVAGASSPYLNLPKSSFLSDPSSYYNPLCLYPASRTLLSRLDLNLRELEIGDIPEERRHKIVAQAATKAHI